MKLAQCCILGLLIGTSILKCDSLATLATALKSLDTNQLPKPITNPSSGLLGPWMLQNQPKKLIAYNENFNNQGAKVYQIKVLQQWVGDCWIHAFRNCIYVMDLALSPRQDFDHIYNNMVARNQYEAFIKHGCPKKGFVSPAFIQEQLDCIPHCIPTKSLEYLERTLSFEYRTPSTQQAKSIDTLLNSREKKEPSQKVISDYALLTDSFNIQSTNIDRLITLMHGLHNNKDYCCGIYLGIVSMEHGVMLVINKNDGVYEYLFSDSNNMSFTGNNYTWKEGNTTITQNMSKQEYLKDMATFDASIAKIISFVHDQEHFNDMVVRALYAKAVENYSEKDLNDTNYTTGWKNGIAFGTKPFETFHNDLKKYNLLNNSLYVSVYKPLYDNLMVKLLYVIAMRDYYFQKNFNIEQFGMQNWKLISDFSVKYLTKFYDNLKQHGLLNNELYNSTYKKLYCNAIKKEQSEQNDSKKYYATLLQKIAC